MIGVLNQGFHKVENPAPGLEEHPRPLFQRENRALKGGKSFTWGIAAACAAAIPQTPGKEKELCENRDPQGFPQ